MMVFLFVCAIDLVVGFLIGRRVQRFTNMLKVAAAFGLLAAVAEQIAVWWLTDQTLGQVALHLITGVMVHITLLILVAATIRQRRLAATEGENGATSPSAQASAPSDTPE